MSKELWVLAEHTGGKLKKITQMTLCAGRELVTQTERKLCALLLAGEAGPLIQELAACGVEKIYLAEDSAFGLYNTEPYATVIAELAGRENPEPILLGHSIQGKDLAPRLAQRLPAPLVSDCVSIESVEGKLLFKRPVYAGKAFAWLATQGSPLLATLRPNAFAIERATATEPEPEQELVRLDNPLSGGNLRVLVKELLARVSARAPLNEAEIVVSGGRGLKSAENFTLIEELADLLGAAVGASRAVVDAGWRDYGEQVGQTGKVVAPSLYFAFGISGALQHIAGMSSSKMIVAVNKDREAPIFRTADYGIVADALEVLPVLTAEFKKVLS